MAKTSNASVNVADVLNSTGRDPAAETRGIRLTIKPTRFVASVKKDGTFKTISLVYQTIRIENETMAQQYGFPIGATIAINGYLPVKKANKAQLTRAVNEWRKAQAAKASGNDGAGTMSIEDFADEDGDDTDE